MEADDLLCSRNARPQKGLVGRAQWKINQPPSMKREGASLERGGSRQTILLARGTRGGSSVWLDGLSGLYGSSDEVFGPTNQTNQIDDIDQMNQISFDARSEGLSGDSPVWISAGGCSRLARDRLIRRGFLGCENWFQKTCQLVKWNEGVLWPQTTESFLMKFLSRGR
jgi:hypothetical protein